MSTRQLAEVIEQVGQLTNDEKLVLAIRLLEEIQTLKSETEDLATLQRVDGIPSLKRQKERAWIEQHRTEYARQWVALDGDRLICHSFNASEVFETARRLGYSSPYVMQVQPSEELPFAGW